MIGRLADEITGERIANFYIGREWHEVYATDEAAYDVQCEDCGHNELTADFSHLAGIMARLICPECGTDYMEVLPKGVGERRAIEHALGR